MDYGILVVVLVPNDHMVGSVGKYNHTNIVLMDQVLKILFFVK